MNWIQKLFKKNEPPKSKVIWSGTISSKGPEQQGPITVLALRTDFDKSEWDEGCINAEIDFMNNKPIEANLNYPFSPYARGYIETYRGLKYKKEQMPKDVWDFIAHNQDDNDCAGSIEKKFHIPAIIAKDLIFDWALGNREVFNEKVFTAKLH